MKFIFFVDSVADRKKEKSIIRGQEVHPASRS